MKTHLSPTKRLRFNVHLCTYSILHNLPEDHSALVFIDVCVLYVGSDACVFMCRHLGGEVPVEDALAVQVLQSPSDVQSQAEPRAPRQVHVAAQQLLQVTAVDELDQEHREGRQQQKQKGAD